MATWTKDPKHGGFSKSAKLTDGEMISLLLGGGGASNAEMMEKCYPSFCEIDEARTRSFGLIFLTFALALLSYFEVVKSFSSSGIEIGGQYLKHISLVLSAFVGVYNSMLETKHTFYKCWFDHIYKKSSPYHRVDLLLSFPKAFDVMKFSHASVGYPVDVWPERFRLFLPFAALVLVGVVLMVAASLTLYIALAMSVWNSNALSPLASKATVLCSAFLMVLSFMMPKYFDFTRRYRHYGITNLLGRMESSNPGRWRHFSNRIAQIRIRMGLIK